MMERSGTGDVKEEYIRRIAYAYHTSPIRGDGTMIYSDGEFNRSITSASIKVPYFDGRIVVSKLTL
jgi:hypothetical protein